MKPSPRQGAAQLSPVKGYLTDHSADLAEQVGLLEGRRRRVLRRWPSRSTSTTTGCSPSTATKSSEILGRLEESLRRRQPGLRADGGDRRRRAEAGPVRRRHRRRLRRLDPEDAVSFTLTTPDGKELKQPGNLFFLTETALYGTNPDLQAKGVKPDVDGDGKVEFGEGLPDANIYKATCDEFEKQAEDARRRRAGVRTDPVRRADLDRDHDPDDERVLRGLEELALHRRRGRRGTGLRRHLAALRHRRHPRRHPRHLQGDGADDRRREPAAGEQTKKELESLSPSPPTSATARPSGEKFTAKQADALGAQAQARPRRSPAR